MASTVGGHMYRTFPWNVDVLPVIEQSDASSACLNMPLILLLCHTWPAVHTHTILTVSVFYHLGGVDVLYAVNLVKIGPVVLEI